jgi:hypothetical protein
MDEQERMYSSKLNVPVLKLLICVEKVIMEKKVDEKAERWTYFLLRLIYLTQRKPSESRALGSQPRPMGHWWRLRTSVFTSRNREYAG